MGVCSGNSRRRRGTKPCCSRSGSRCFSSTARQRSLDNELYKNSRLKTSIFTNERTNERTALAIRLTPPPLGVDRSPCNLRWIVSFFRLCRRSFFFPWCVAAPADTGKLQKSHAVGVIKGSDTREREGRRFLEK